MYPKLLILLIALTLLNALSIKEVISKDVSGKDSNVKDVFSIGEMRLEVFDTVEDDFMKGANGISVTPKLITTVTFFEAVSGQQLVGRALDQVLPIGTNRVRLTYISNPSGHTLVSNVVAELELPPGNSVVSQEQHTVQGQRDFQGDIVLNSPLTSNAYFSWYVYATVDFAGSSQNI